MVNLGLLWLPMLLSAVGVFFFSSLVHMVLKWHKHDYRQVQDADALMDAMRKQSMTPGLYPVPYCSEPKDMEKPEMIARYERGPLAMITVIPTGRPAMGKYLGLWFAYCLVVSLFTGYLLHATLEKGVPYMSVFRVAGTVAFMAYGVGQIVDSIWKGQPWPNTIRHVIDGLVYALITAGVFGWLWPQ